MIRGSGAWFGADDSREGLFFRLDAHHALDLFGTSVKVHADKRVVVENMDPRLDTSSGLVSGATIIAESLLHLIESMLFCI